MAASEGPGEDTSKWNMWSFRLFDVFLCDLARLPINESKWGVSRKGLQVYILHMWLPGGVSCWMPHSKIVGFLTWRKASAGSRAKIVKWRFSAPGFPLEVSLYLLASEAAQVHVIKWLCAIQGWHWSYARVVSRVRLYKWRLSSGCLQFKVSYLRGKSYQVNIFCSCLGSGGVQVLAGK